MLVDYAEYPKSLDDVPSAATETEAIGYDTHWVSETTCDPFIAATVASASSSASLEAEQDQPAADPDEDEIEQSQGHE